MMALAALALTVLVILPLASLLLGSVTGEGGLTFGHFREALSRRLYVQALRNSLVLGAWTALLSVAVGLPMAWAVSRTDVPGKPFIHATAMIAYLTPPYLTAIAFVYLFSPNAGLVNRWVRDVLGLPHLTFNIHSMAGLVLVTALHTFPFVYLLAASALECGERMIAAEGADQYSWVDQKAGHKIKTVIPSDGAFAVAAPTAVIKGSPHPNAAKAFAEFMISDSVQKLFPGEGIYAARIDVEPPPGNPPMSQIKLWPIDYDYVEKEAKKLKDRFAEIFQ